MSERNRAKTGEFAPEVTDEVILSVLRQGDAPAVTATEVAAEVDMTRRAVTRRLKRMHDEGLVGRKEVGARAVVWWLTEDDTDAGSTTHEQAFEDFAARVTEQWPEKIEQIILYGSTARGEARGIDSDVDVMLITPTEQAKETVYDPATAISLDVMIEQGVALSLNFKTTTELEEQRDRAYVRNVLQEGCVYG
jgi:predicted nucleotidyltransferase